MEFDEARRIAFEALAETETIRVFQYTEQKAAKLQKYPIVWQITTEIFLPGDIVRPINLLMALTDEFPLVLPKIYLSVEDKLSVGFIPHVDVAGLICIYDEESIVVNPEQSASLVKTCLDKARQILEQGLQGSNQEDFSDEFVSYWSQVYDDKDTLHAGLSMVKQLPSAAPCLVKFLKLKESYTIYTAILYEEGEDINRFKKYLNDRGHSTTEQEAFYLGITNDLYPPFNFTNAKAYQFIKDHFPAVKKEFELYLNRKTAHKLILFAIPSVSEQLFFGLYIRHLDTKRNGYRDGKLTPLNVFNNLQRNQSVLRMKFDTYTDKRLELRTDGIEIKAKYSITIAGLGSIGSNLLPYLMPIGINSMQLIDPDVLTLENTNRHLLGLDFIGQSKVHGLYAYFKQVNPLLDIIPSKGSVIQLMMNNINIFNERDYLFVVVGKDPIEEYIFKALHEQRLTIPVFIIWIEPYLLGGHCLYINPGHLINYTELYTDHLFNYNVIDASEYKNLDRQLQLREAGCQGSYTPYGQKNITLFLSSLVSYIYNIVDNKDQRNLIITWRGNAPDDILLKLSSYGRDINPGAIQMTEINGNKNQ